MRLDTACKPVWYGYPVACVRAVQAARYTKVDGLYPVPGYMLRFCVPILYCATMYCRGTVWGTVASTQKCTVPGYNRVQ